MNKTKDFINKAIKWVNKHGNLPPDIKVYLDTDEVTQGDRDQLRELGFTLDTSTDNTTITVTVKE